MTWEMHPQEFASVTKLAPEARYRYFVKKAVDHQGVWGLWNEGWAVMGNKEQDALIPVWPHPDFAKACANGEWGEYQPKLIELNAWLEKWTPGMLKEHRKVAVFPTADRLTTTIDPDRLRADLESELQEYE